MAYECKPLPVDTKLNEVEEYLEAAEAQGKPEVAVLVVRYARNVDWDAVFAAIAA